MRKFKKILKWTGLIILLIIAGVLITVMARQNLKYERPYPEITASADTAIIARGKHLIFSSAHCADCHSKTNADSLINLGLEVPLTGGVLFDLPFGKIYTKNISMDKETGIGNYTDKDIARSLRYGVNPDGVALLPFMPFHNMTDEDLTAVISYLRTQKPVNNDVPPTKLNLLGKFIKAFLIKPMGPSGEVAKSIKPDTTVAYGQYLATSVANCGGCHTDRSPTGSFIGVPFAGGPTMVEHGVPFDPPNLTTDSSSRIYGWTQQNFLNRFRLGKVHAKSPMPWPSYKRMTDTEIIAIYKFLKSLAPAKTKQPAVKK